MAESSEARHLPDTSAGGVPMWRMGEHGPSQILLPFPSGQGTDGEIDQWLAQTRAVTRMHQQALPQNCNYNLHGGYEYAPSKDRPQQPALPAQTQPKIRDAGTCGDKSEVQRGGVQRGPSTIQTLREIVSTSSSPQNNRTGGLHYGASRPTPAQERLQIQGGSRLVRNGITASGRHTRPRHNGSLPVETAERTQPTSAASSTGVLRSPASFTSPKKKGSNSQSKAGAAASKAQHAMVKLAAEYADISIFPRRKAGQSGIGSNRPPVVITREVLEEHFNMPLLSVCKKLGLCATVLKKVCRQLGVFKWPYKETKLIARRQGRVIAPSAPIPPDLRNINAAVASASSLAASPLKHQHTSSSAKRKIASIAAKDVAGAGVTGGTARAAGGSNKRPRLSLDNPHVLPKTGSADRPHASLKRACAALSSSMPVPSRTTHHSSKPSLKGSGGVKARRVAAEELSQMQAWTNGGMGWDQDGRSKSVHKHDAVMHTKDDRHHENHEERLAEEGCELEAAMLQLDKVHGGLDDITAEESVESGVEAQVDLVEDIVSESEETHVCAVEDLWQEGATVQGVDSVYALSRCARRCRSPPQALHDDQKHGIPTDMPAHVDPSLAHTIIGRDRKFATDGQLHETYGNDSRWLSASTGVGLQAHGLHHSMHEPYTRTLPSYSRSLSSLDAHYEALHRGARPHFYGSYGSHGAAHRAYYHAPHSMQLQQMRGFTRSALLEDMLDDTPAAASNSLVPPTPTLATGCIGSLNERFDVN